MPRRSRPRTAREDGSEVRKLMTENLSARYAELDRWPTAEALDAMYEGQLSAVAALGSQMAALAEAAEAAAAVLKGGGRLVYVGAGTSGRIAVLDGVELGPTFGWPNDRLVFLVAGGPDALTVSVEGAEDDAEAGRGGIIDAAIGAGDVVIGVAASGTTPYTVAALDAAAREGALTIGVANNDGARLLRCVGHPILAATGNELLAGSTRMKAGTAQKALLSMLSTAIMLRLDRVYKGQMVDMIVSNNKLRDRAERIVSDISGCTVEVAAESLIAAGSNIKQAVLIARGLPAADSRRLLEKAKGSLRRALEETGPIGGQPYAANGGENHNVQNDN